MTCDNPCCANFDPGTVGAEPPHTIVNARSSLTEMYAFGRWNGWYDGFNGLTRDHRFEVTLASPSLVSLFTYEQLAAYGDGYVVGYSEGVADAPTNPPGTQPPAPEPVIDPGTGTLVCDVVNIQTALNRGGANIDVDGNWGPATQAAWIASGKTCAELVASCTACPGSYTPGTAPPGTTPPGTTPPGGTPVGYEQPAKKASVWPWVIGGLAVAGIAGIAYMSVAGPKKNPIKAKVLNLRSYNLGVHRFFNRQSKADAVKFAHEHGWRTQDVTQAANRFMAFWIVGQQIDEHTYRVLNKDGSWEDIPYPGRF